MNDAAEKAKYDTNDIVRRDFVLLANGLKFASYRVRDMAAAARGEEKFSELQHHLTYVPTSSFGEDRQVVDTGGATIYAMLTDTQVKHLEKFLEKPVTAGRSLRLTDFWIDCFSPESVAPKVQMILGCDEQVLGVMALATAEMICTLAKKARGDAA